MFIRLIFILLFCCESLIKCENGYGPHISAVLRYLNANPNRVYEYEKGVLVNAQQKANIVEIAVRIDVTCSTNTQNLGVPCTEQQQICTAFVQRNDEDNYKVLGDVSCKPKRDSSSESLDEDTPVLTNSVQNPNIELSHEAVPSDQNADFVAVKLETVPCLGCPFDINTNVEGISQLVDSTLKHVETERERKQALVKVIRLQQQVVAGIKYILLVEIAPTVCNKNTDPSNSNCAIDENAHTSICEVIFWQRPWIAKTKSIIGNNCTLSQEYTFSNDNSKGNNIDDKSNKNDLKSSSDGQIGNNINEKLLSDLESQILPIDDTNSKPVTKSNHEFNVESVMTNVQESTKYQYNLQEPVTTSHNCYSSPIFFSKIQSVQSTDNSRTDQPDQNQEDQYYINNNNNSRSSSDENVAVNTVKRSTRNKRFYSRYRREVLVGGSTNIPVNDSTVLQFTEDALTKLDSVSEQSNRHKVVDIISATSQVVAGVKYRIKVKISLSNCLKNDSTSLEDCEFLQNAKIKLCDIVIWDRPWLKQKQTTVKCDDSDIEYSFDNTPKNRRSEKSKPNEQYIEENVENLSENNAKVEEKLKTDLKYFNMKNQCKIKDILNISKRAIPGNFWNIKAKISFADIQSEICDIHVWYPYFFPDEKEINVESVCRDNSVSYFWRKKIIEEDMAADGIGKKSLFNFERLGHLIHILNDSDVEPGYNNTFKILEIISVQKQFVFSYFWMVKTDVAYVGNLIDLQKSLDYVCIFKTWDLPWQVYERDIKVSCENKVKSRRHRLKRYVGALEDIFPGSFDVDFESNSKSLEYVKTGLQYLNTRLKKGTYTVDKIVKVSKQLVAGRLWHITAVLSNCIKFNATQSCEDLNENENKVCQFKIWEQPWVTYPLKITIICENDTNLYTFAPTASQNYNNRSYNVPDMFRDFMLKNNKSYLNEVEYSYRLKVFKNNLNRIELLNKYEQGSATYGITQFADLTVQEFSKSRGLRLDLHQKNENYLPFMKAVIPAIDLPTEFDWRKKNAVTEVKNQGSCGSCWAFSTTGNIEGQYAIKYGKLLEFSEQELVDCDKLDQGCNGGLMDNAYRSIEEMGGLEAESDYPYEGDNEKCHFNKTKVRVEISGALNISHNETDMAKWLVQNGPIAIAINANAMQFYVGGVSHPWRILCNPNSLDHGVLIVGFGVHTYQLFNKTLPYWIIKNSWGPSWGEQGYYRVYRGDGTCGLNQTPSSSIVA